MDYLDDAIPGPTSIMGLPSTLGRWLQHTLLRNEGGHQWPFVERWELDWVVADPNGYLDRRVPQWMRETLAVHDHLAEFRLPEPRPKSIRPAPAAPPSHNDG